MGALYNLQMKGIYVTTYYNDVCHFDVGDSLDVEFSNLYNDGLAQDCA